MFEINTSYRSPNFDIGPIDVEFVVIHSTNCSLEKTLEILCSETSKVSCHFVIAESGEIFELVQCLAGGVNRAWHAGESKWNDGEKEWTALNDNAIGIELVNKNGNIFEFTEEQYISLNGLILELQKRFLALGIAENILGHEHIAGFRGKVDPGLQFNWNRIWKKNYPNQDPPVREPKLRPDLALPLKELGGTLTLSDDAWPALSRVIEILSRENS